MRTWKAQGIPLEDFAHVRRWYDALKEREGLRRGVALGSDMARRGEMSEEERRNLFGTDKARVQ